MKIAYSTKRLSAVASRIIQQANQIIFNYAEQGFTLTLRQLYYQFVATDAFPASWADPATGSTNNERSYKRLGDIISDARMCGLMDWESIIDRTRSLRSMPHWNTPADIVKACAAQYNRDLWEGQPYRVEVWVEKDAAIGVIEQVCRELRVPYFSCRGYTSQSAMWEASQRLMGYSRDGQHPMIVHLGDHDPSGIDMSRDIEERLRAFMDHHGYSRLRFDRLALNMRQVEEYTPPPNPTKVTDSRAAGYIERFGAECWELDALEPAVVAALIRDAVADVRDDRKWTVLAKAEAKGRKQLKSVSGKWDAIVKGIK